MVHVSINGVLRIDGTHYYYYYYYYQHHHFYIRSFITVHVCDSQNAREKTPKSHQT